MFYQVLAGLKMPAGLVPVVNGQTPLDSFTATFSTESLDAPTAFDLIAHELKRMGFTVQPNGQFELTAERKGRQVLGVIHPKASKVTFAGEPRFPSVAPDSVVSELST